MRRHEAHPCIKTHIRRCVTFYSPLSFLDLLLVSPTDWPAMDAIKSILSPFGMNTGAIQDTLVGPELRRRMSILTFLGSLRNW